MNLFDNFNISISGQPYLIVAGIIFILLYSVFVYKVTLPKINNFYKTVLIVLRTIALSALLLLMFDPIIGIKNKIKIEPVNLIFIDNSKSVEHFTNKNDLITVKQFIKELPGKLKGKTRIYSFGKSLDSISVTQIDSLAFNETTTQFNSLFNKAKNNKNVSSIILISDGIINEGKNPVTSFEKLGIPVYTIAVGDTTKDTDVKISSIRSNKYIYPGRETVIEVAVSNTGLSGKYANVKLLEKNKLLGKQKVLLSTSGINRIRFTYLTKTPGEHILTAAVGSEEKETNKNNNVKTKIINVLETKKKIVILSGSPSNDVAAIIGSLKGNKDFETEQIIQVSENKFYTNKKDIEKINQADVLVLINFPSSITKAIQLKEVIKKISANQTPLLFCISNNTDFTKLEKLKTFLPFTIKNKTDGFIEAQVSVTNQPNFLLGKTEDEKEIWNELPPVNIPITNITPNASCNILLKSKTRNETAVVFSNNINGNKSLVINAANIWRWKLQAKNKEYKTFDNFIFNTIKWLANKDDKKRFRIKPNKKNYKLGETVTFTAELYNETFEPINKAEIILEIFNKRIKKKYNFTYVESGLYECKTEINKPGIYNYKGTVFISGKKVNEINGKFNIEPVELELVNNKTDINLLKTLSKVSGGIFLTINTLKKLSSLINERYEENIKIVYEDKKLHLSSLDFILILIVLIFSIEWILRKILRMI